MSKELPEEKTTGKKTRRWWIVGAAIVVLLLLGLALPVSNLVLGRTYVEVTNNDPQFQQVSRLLQLNCADCHTPDLTHYPIYFDFPIASSIIAEDLKKAKEYMVIDVDELTGKKPLNAVQMAKTMQVLEDHSMPPLNYRAMHWDTGFNDEQRNEVSAWFESIPGGYGPLPIPEVNPFDPNPDKVALGDKLYHDTRLSGDNTISCATCHDLATGGVDLKAVSTGIDGQQGPINAPTVYNAAFNFAQFWDGRAHDLQEQAAGPVENPLEMGATFDAVVKKLSEDPEYVAEFKKIYNGEISKETITDAIAEFEKTLLTPNCQFDHYLRDDKKALTEEQLQGYQLFLDHQCATCHTGVILGGLTYERMGQARDYFKMRGGEITEADLGRYNVTKKEYDRHKFKTPTLRNIELTPPYFHDGSAKTLDEAVRTMAEVQTGQPLSESEVKQIVAYLKTLTGYYQGKLLTDAPPKPSK